MHHKLEGAFFANIYGFYLVTNFWIICFHMYFCTPTTPKFYTSAHLLSRQIPQHHGRNWSYTQARGKVTSKSLTPTEANITSLTTHTHTGEATPCSREVLGPLLASCTQLPVPCSHIGLPGQGPGKKDALSAFNSGDHEVVGGLSRL